MVQRYQQAAQEHYLPSLDHSARFSDVNLVWNVAISSLHKLLHMHILECDTHSGQMSLLLSIISVKSSWKAFLDVQNYAEIFLDCKSQ